MELIQLPLPMRSRGFTGWPEVYRIGKNDPMPPAGISFVMAEEVDFALVFRLMVPILMKQHPFFDWREIYLNLVGLPYREARVYQMFDENHVGGEGHSHEGTGGPSKCEVTLEELAADDATYVDLDMLTDLSMIPAFMTDIRDAITTNVTNNYAWTDGRNKKTGVCTGSMVEMPQARSLVILDISGSIPDGVSAGMLMLIKTITGVVNSDLIITGSSSYFYTKEEVMSLDIRWVRENIGRGNESDMFREILDTHDMNYKNIITFGDSDWPGRFGAEVEFTSKVAIDNWYSFFCMKKDTYGNSWEAGAGYGRWIPEACPHVNIIHNHDWAKFFNAKAPSR